MRGQVAVLFLAWVSVSAYAAEDYWVTSDVLDVRTCPATSCGVVGHLRFLEKASVLEVKNGSASLKADVERVGCTLQCQDPPGGGCECRSRAG
jgi:hypothetical protein